MSSIGSEPWPNENTEKGGGLDLLHLTLMKMMAPQVLSDKRKDVSLSAGRWLLNIESWKIRTKVFRRSQKFFQRCYIYHMFNRQTHLKKRVLSSRGWAIISVRFSGQPLNNLVAPVNGAKGIYLNFQLLDYSTFHFQINWNWNHCRPYFGVFFLGKEDVWITVFIVFE